MANFLNATGTSLSDTLVFSGTGSKTQFRVDAGDGDDVISLNGVSSIAIGGVGNDTVMANHGDDTVRGGEGNDQLLGNGGRDKVFGGEGNDYVDGGSGFDRIFGGVGDDTLRGGDDDDVIYGDVSDGNKDGSIGADTFIFDADDGNDKVLDFADDIDVVVLEGGADVTLSYHAGNTIMTFGATTVTFFKTELEQDDFTGDFGTFDVI